ncbi:hypothetical protein BDW74DRAFT_164879 [Aspergillus multicolor]|uniref:uncharacterized protein n=1 Tax=Aspergillus multicolor TaxID=41759 RepID=UPI003CCD487F
MWVKFQPLRRALSVLRKRPSVTRRHTGLPAIPLPSIVSRAYSIALIGTGYRGYRCHFLSLLEDPSLSITAVCDTNLPALESFSAQHHGIPAYNSLSRLLQSHKPDFAIVSVPHNTHMECITTLAASGVHVLKEKPIANSVAEYKWMAGLPVTIGVTFQKRFEAQFVHFKSLFPLVGDVAAVEAHLALNITNLEETWRASCEVGVTEDLGCHMLDLLVWLFGLPASVMAQQVSSVRPGQRYGGDDIADVLIDWGPGKCTGHVRLSRVAHQPAQFLRVTGTDGTLSLDGLKITHHDTQGHETLRTMHQPNEKQVIRSMVCEFGDWVSGRRADFSTSLGNVRDTVSAVDAIKTSLATRQIQRPLLLSSNSSLRASSRRSFSKFACGQGSTAGPHTSSPSMTRTESFLLNTGASIPALGLGTRRVEKAGMAYDTVRSALRVGYRHVDTAQSSGNEHEIGQAVEDSGVPRDQIWLTTKLDNRWHTRVEEALELSLHALKTDYIDLYLMHWPVSINPHDPATVLADWDYIRTWQEMQKLPMSRVRNIGLSNFGISHLKRLLSHPSCRTIPAVNQIELHPYWPSPKLLDFCKSNGIHCTAYSCLGSAQSPLLQDPTLLEISRRKSKSPQQVLYLTIPCLTIMWGIQRGTSVIPRTVKDAYLKENFALDGWRLSDAEMGMLNNCTTRFKSCSDDWLPARVFPLGDDQ